MGFLICACLHISSKIDEDLWAKLTPGIIPLSTKVGRINPGWINHEWIYPALGKSWTRWPPEAPLSPTFLWLWIIFCTNINLPYPRWQLREKKTKNKTTHSYTLSSSFSENLATLFIYSVVCINCLSKSKSKSTIKFGNRNCYAKFPFNIVFVDVILVLSYKLACHWSVLLIPWRKCLLSLKICKTGTTWTLMCQ